jgi:hypothetical protein
MPSRASATQASRSARPGTAAHQKAFDFEAQASSFQAPATAPELTGDSASIGKPDAARTQFGLDDDLFGPSRR